jgi:hypothetical protein
MFLPKQEGGDKEEEDVIVRVERAEERSREVVLQECTHSTREGKDGQ